MQSNERKESNEIKESTEPNESSAGKELDKEKESKAESKTESKQIEKLKTLWVKKKEKWKDPKYRKQVLILSGCCILVAFVMGVIAAEKTTIYDMPIHYTRVVEEEFDTEGAVDDTGETPAETPAEEAPSEEAPAETPAEEAPSEEAPAETPAEETPSEEAPAETPEETSSEVSRPRLPVYEIKGNMLSTNHRPWILSHLSDMFLSLQFGR